MGGTKGFPFAGRSALQQSQQPAARSFLADILLPDTTGVAQDFLYQSWQADRNGDATGEGEFQDAQSFFGSIRSGLSSFVSASASGVAQGASFFSAASGAAAEPAAEYLRGALVRL